MSMIYPKQKNLYYPSTAQEKMQKTALEDRKKELGKKVQECNTRIVWIEEDVKAGGYVSSGQYANWRPGENIPHGEMHSDTD